nr:MAG TPA: GDSL-like Lipase/Acylhydrolase family [Caudoviricetes sp.]
MALTAKKVYAILKRQISDMEAKLNSPVRYRGTVATADLLPLNPDIGDMYNIESKSIYGEAGMNVAWNGVVWDTMGAPIDMSLYLTKEGADTIIQNMVNEYLEKNPVKPGATTEQAQQIEQNKTDVASLKEETSSLKEDVGNIASIVHPNSTMTADDYTGYSISFGKSVKNHRYIMITENEMAPTAHQLRNLINGVSWSQYNTIYKSKYSIITATENGELRFNSELKYSGILAVYDVTDNDILLKNIIKNIKKSLNYVIVSGELENILENISEKSTNVYCIGDSLTMGAITDGEHAWENGYSYPAKLQDRLGKVYNVVNLGIGGEGTETINARMCGFIATSENAKATELMIPADASTKVKIKISAYNRRNIIPFKQESNALTFGSESAINPCIIGGIKGNISLENGEYYFTRSESGNAKSLYYEQFVSTKALRTINKSDTLIFWCGQNDLYAGAKNVEMTDIETVPNRIDNMIRTFDCKNYIIIGNIATNENQVANTNAVKLNELQSERYGNHFVDAKYLLINYGLQAVGITPTEQDMIDIANNRVPTSLRCDEIHLNEKGYSYVANIVYLKGVELGYWD